MSVSSFQDKQKWHCRNCYILCCIGSPVVHPGWTDPPFGYEVRRKKRLNIQKVIASLTVVEKKISVRKNQRDRGVFQVPQRLVGLLWHLSEWHRQTERPISPDDVESLVHQNPDKLDRVLNRNKTERRRKSVRFILRVEYNIQQIIIRAIKRS